jgi:hypothetical protein
MGDDTKQREEYKDLELNKGTVPPHSNTLPPAVTGSLDTEAAADGAAHTDAVVTPRTFFVNDHAGNSQYRFPPNVVKTSRYTIITFLPLNLFEQFRRLANFYFLVCVLLQIIPNVSPFPIWTIALPLAFILAITAIKEGYEDVVSFGEIFELFG